MNWKIYSFEHHNALVLSAHEKCDMVIGVEMVWDYFLYHTQCPMVWSMEKINTFRGIPTKYTAVTGHVQQS